MVSEPLLTSIRESFGRVVYTHKTHEKQIELLSSSLTVVRWTQACLIALTAGGAIAVVFGTGYAFQLATAVLASLATGVTVYQLSFDPSRAIEDHRMCARRLWLIREKYVNLLVDLTDGTISADDGRKCRDSLLKEMQDIYLDAPDTSSRAYAIAQRALKISEEMTFSDEEIDRFLPKPLKRTE